MPLKLAEMFRSRGLELSRVSVLNRFKPSNSVGCLQHFRFVPRLLSGALAAASSLSSRVLRLSTSPFVLSDAPRRRSSLRLRPCLRGQAAGLGTRVLQVGPGR